MKRSLAMMLAICAVVLDVFLYSAGVHGASAVGCGHMQVPPGHGSQEVCASAELTDCVGGSGNRAKGRKARVLCEDVGFRLCSLTELKNEEAKGSGCGFNNDLVWTGTECDTQSGEPGLWVAKAKNGKNKQCWPEHEKEFKAAVVCCGDLETPQLQWWVGDSVDGANTPEFEFFGDPDGNVPFVSTGVTFTAVTLRIFRMVEDLVNPFDLVGSPDIPVYYSSPGLDGIDEPNEWLQITVPVDYVHVGGTLTYFSTTDSSKSANLIVGTGIYVTGPNPPGSATTFNYFENMQPVVPINEEDSVNGIPIITGGAWVFMNMGADASLALSTAPVNGLAPVIPSLGACGANLCPVIAGLPAGFAADIYLYNSLDNSTEFDQLITARHLD